MVCGSRVTKVPLIRRYCLLLLCLRLLILLILVLILIVTPTLTLIPLLILMLPLLLLPLPLPLPRRQLLVRLAAATAATLPACNTSCKERESKHQYLTVPRQGLEPVQQVLTRCALQMCVSVYAHAHTEISTHVSVYIFLPKTYTYEERIEGHSNRYFSRGTGVCVYIYIHTYMPLPVPVPMHIHIQTMRESKRWMTPIMRRFGPFACSERSCRPKSSLGKESAVPQHLPAERCNFVEPQP